MRKILAVVLALVVMFSFVGCNSNEDKVADYVRTATSTTEFQQAVNSFAVQGLKVEVEARGDDIVYKYTYTSDVGDEDLVVDSLLADDSVYTSSAAAVHAEASFVDKVIFEFYNMNGKLLTSIEK